MVAPSALLPWAKLACSGNSHQVLQVTRARDVPLGLQVRFLLWVVAIRKNRGLKAQRNRKNYTETKRGDAALTVSKGSNWAKKEGTCSNIKKSSSI
ncbi:hypothetical protein GmHk_04G011418 [Glycine max]|nr:hypothetical protein GmHk_04G011418 [Glycine max]